MKLFNELVWKGMRAYGEHEGVSEAEKAECIAFMEAAFVKANVGKEDVAMFIEELKKPELSTEAINFAAMLAVYTD